ncbi:hypothetical protein ACFWXO_30995 [Kitasatospora sp. NPDC059088]|uniref:hypothetical protein n=1 Tax=Kitasatospora sp. NPDC059088 TaxID=3346722 RepID=UPI0036C90563
MPRPASRVRKNLPQADPAPAGRTSRVRINLRSAARPDAPAAMLATVGAELRRLADQAEAGSLPRPAILRALADDMEGARRQD